MQNKITMRDAEQLTRYWRAYGRAFSDGKPDGLPVKVWADKQVTSGDVLQAVVLRISAKRQTE